MEISRWELEQRLRVIKGELDFFSDDENRSHFEENYGRLWMEDYLNELLDELIEIRKLLKGRK